MSIEAAGRNVLCLIAHPDDAELMAGGTIAKWVAAGDRVRVLTFTDGLWRSPRGVLVRRRRDALSEEKAAAAQLGYAVENLKRPALGLRFGDDLVCEVLRHIEEWKVDTLLCPWPGDLHHDHEVVCRVAEAASRRVPRVLMGQINHHLREFFAPNVFVDITATWERKISAARCFRSEWGRTGEDTLDFLDSVTRYYGKLCGVQRAEGFITKKFLL